MMSSTFFQFYQKFIIWNKSQTFWDLIYNLLASCWLKFIWRLLSLLTRLRMIRNVSNWSQIPDVLREAINNTGFVLLIKRGSIQSYFNIQYILYWIRVLRHLASWLNRVPKIEKYRFLSFDKKSNWIINGVWGFDHHLILESKSF